MFLEQEKTFEQKKEDYLLQCYLKSNSNNSRRNAEKMIKSFNRFLKAKYPSITEQKAIEEMIGLKESSKLYLFLNEYVQYLLSEKLAPRSIRLYFAYIKDYSRYHGIRIYNEDAKQFIKLPKILKEKKRPLLYETIGKLLGHCGTLYKSLILFAVSSGMRISEILGLTIDDINTSTKPVTVRVRAEIAKMGVERITFISNEAYEALKPIIARREKGELIYFPHRTSELLSSVETAFSKIRKRAELLERTGTGLHQVRIHRFRDFFITQTDLIHEGLGHALAGHDKYMDEYETFTDEQLREFYLKVEPMLTINNDERNKKIILEKDAQIKKQGEMEKRLMQLEDWKKRHERLNANSGVAKS